jgi:hypothetical protein
MSDAPWGYAGWKLYDHFARTAVPGGEYFLCYLLRDQVIAETALPWRAGFRRGPLPPGAVLLDTGRVSVGFFRVAYRVADWGGKGESPMPWCYRPLDRERYLQKPLPLDAREWSEYLDRLRKARPPG